MEYNAESVAQALQQFYCNSSLRHEVHKWLTMAQVSTDAWSFCWDLLSPDKGVESQFYGASTLHVKISRYWLEVPPDKYESLKGQLLEKIVQYVNGPKVILTRLCVALSSLAIHTMPDVWPNAVENIISTFQQGNFPNCNPVQVCQILLEIITIVPEEFCSANLSQHRRGILRHELSNCLKHVLPLLQSVLTPSSPYEVCEPALKCFSSWVEFGVPVIDAESIILQVFQALHKEQLFDNAIDALVTVFSHPDSLRFPNTVQKLLPQVLLLQPMFQKALEDSDTDTSSGICRLVVSVAENHSKLLLDSIISNDEQEKSCGVGIINMMLACTSLPGNFPVDETCSDLTFTFWYILQDDMFASVPEKSCVLLPILQPVYLSLVEILLRKVQYPNDSEYESWCADDKEQFRCYRTDIGDTMMYTFNILREPLLGHMCRMLENLMQVPDVRWQVIESIFFLLGSVAESVDFDENLYLPTLLNILLKIPCNNLKLVSTALYMIGSFGEWLNCHPENLGCAIPLILQGLNNSEVATAATLALKDVTRENLDHIRPYASQILTASESALMGNSLKSRECVRLMSSVGQVLSVLPLSDIMQYLQWILTPHIETLEILAKAQPSAATKASILLKLNMLSWLFGSLNTDREEDEEQGIPKPPEEGPKPVFVILQKVSPVIEIIVSKWISDEAIIEGICEMFKRALSTLMDGFSPLVQDVAQLSIQMYEAVPHVSIIDFAKQLTLLFHDDPKFSPIVQGLLLAICNRTLSLLRADIRNHTEVIESFMKLLSQIIKKSKHMIVDANLNVLGLYQASIAGICLPEHQTVKASCAFMCDLISTSSDIIAVHEVIGTNGHILVDRVLRAVGGESPRDVMESFADVILALNRHHIERLSLWLNEMVNKDGYPSMRATRKDKEQFIKSILKARANKKRIRDTVKEFTLLCRGMLGTEYAAQMATII